MATARDIAVGLAGICTSVPHVGDGICDLCHGCPNPGWGRCWSCDSVTGQLSAPCSLVVPISLYEIPSQLHHVLRHYKSGSYPDRSNEFTTYVAALIGHFLERHGDCLSAAAGGGWDVVTFVPSSGTRTGQHPLVTAIKMLSSVRDQYVPLLRRGEAQIDHLHAKSKGYAPRRELHGERVLVIDDTYTSGARAQSAASAINRAGGQVAAIVCVGRVVNPQFSTTVHDYWEEQQRQPFSFATCCLEPF